jgi:hypothetical protein
MKRLPKAVESVVVVVGYAVVSVESADQAGCRERGLPETAHRALVRQGCLSRVLREWV